MASEAGEPKIPERKRRQDWHDKDCAQRFGRDPCDCSYGRPVHIPLSVDRDARQDQSGHNHHLVDIAEPKIAAAIRAGKE